MTEPDIILKFENVHKSFAGVHALKGVDFAVRKGKVNVLAGENGAGKSTLMKILTGALTMDEGRILFEGQPFSVRSPREALDRHIAMIYQEFNLVPQLSVEENMFLGREMTRGGLLNGREIRKRALCVLREYEIGLDPSALVEDLSVAKKQMLEIAKALSFDAKVIIMDEPTSSLTQFEVEHLYRIVRNLLAKDISIIFISHKMDEVYALGDYITVVRDGETIGEWPAGELSADDLITAIAARKIDRLYPKRDVEIGEEVLKVQSLSREKMYSDISFSLRRGEILGMAGLVGAGRTEVALTIFGALAPDLGSVTVGGRDMHCRLPADAMRCGVAYVPEDRKLLGVDLNASIRANIAITNMDSLAKGIFVSDAREKAQCEKAMQMLRIKAASTEQPVGSLSGGNQQKVALVKWISRDVQVLILDEPTRGVDVGAKEEIYKIIGDLAQAGIGILLISSDLPEVMGLSDRILIMHEGQMKGIVSREEAAYSQEALMERMVGSGPAASERSGA